MSKGKEPISPNTPMLSYRSREKEKGERNSRREGRNSGQSTNLEKESD